MYQDDGNNGGGGGPEYVHIDISDQFSKFGKYVVTFVWFVSFLAINYCKTYNKNNNSYSWKVALTSAIIMVWVRHLLHIFFGSQQHGPQLNVYRQIFVQPAIFFVSGSLLQAALRQKANVSLFLFDQHHHNSKQKQYYYNHPRNDWKHYINIILISIVSSIGISEDAAASLFLSGSRATTTTDDDYYYYYYYIYLLCWKIGTSIAGLLSYTSNFATFVVVTASYDVITWRQYFVNLFVPAITLLVMSFSLLVVARRCCGLLLLLPGTNSTDTTTRNNWSNNVAYDVLTRKEEEEDDDEQHDLELTIDTNNNGTTSTAKGSISNDDMNNSTYTTETTQQERSSNTHHQQENNDDPPLLFMSEENPSSLSLLNNITDDDDDDDSKPSWFLVYGLPFIGLPIAFFIFNGQNILWIALTFAILMIWFIGEGGGKGSFDCCLKNNCNNTQQQQQQQPPSTTGSNSADDDHNNKFWSYIDLKPLLLYISWCILTGSLADTGVPQSFLNVAMGKCADQMTSTTCIYKFAFVVYAMAICFSPLVTVIVLLCTFPYASPFDWIQVIVAISMGKFVRSLWTLMTPPPPTTTRYDGVGGGASVVAEGSAATTSWGTIIVWRICVVTVSLFVLWVATTFVQSFHTVYECSVRLGECDDMGWGGGWKK